MSAVTPDHIVRSVWNNARGIGVGPMVTLAQWRTYASDLEGWFSYNGTIVDMRAVSVGGGMYQIKGTIRA